MYISSKLRSAGTTSNFSYNINLPLELYNEITHVSVTSINVPKSFYSIANGYNQFELVENGVHITITIPFGNYSKSQLYVMITSLLTTASLNAIIYTVSDEHSTYDTGKLKITATNNVGLIPIRLDFDNLTDCYDALGFKKNSINTFNANVLVSKNVINLNQKATAIYLNSNVGINEFSNTSNSSSTILACVYGQLFVPYSWISNSFDIIANMNKFNHGLNGTFNFVFTDDENEELDFNGIDCSFTITFFTYTSNEKLYKKVSHFLDYKSTK